MWFFWVILLFAIVLLLWRFLGGPRGSHGGQESAEEIQKRRYERGEISRDEYERMLADLGR
jgi:uncharacterized membrane protein